MSIKQAEFRLGQERPIIHQRQYLNALEKDRPAAQVQGPIQKNKVKQRRKRVPQEGSHLAEALPLLRRAAALQRTVAATTRLHLNINQKPSSPLKEQTAEAPRLRARHLEVQNPAPDRRLKQPQPKQLPFPHLQTPLKALLINALPKPPSTHAIPPHLIIPMIASILHTIQQTVHSM